MMDKKRQAIQDWAQQASDSKTALLPKNLPDAILQLLTEDTKDLHLKNEKEQIRAPESLTFAVLLLKGKIEEKSRLELTSKELQLHIAMYLQALHLEMLERKGVLTYSPEQTVENIFSGDQIDFELTEKGKMLGEEMNEAGLLNRNRDEFH